MVLSRRDRILNWSRRDNRTTPFLEPRTRSEEELARIWSELLQIDRVGVWDNFFELGGHSLLAMRVINKIQQVFGVLISLRQIFDTPTLAGWAQYLDSVSENSLSSQSEHSTAPSQDREEGLI